MVSAKRRTRRVRWGSLLVAVLCIALAIAALLIIPSSPINSSHTQQETAPGSVTLPPTTTPIGP